MGIEEEQSVGNTSFATTVRTNAQPQDNMSMHASSIHLDLNKEDYEHLLDWPSERRENQHNFSMA